MNNAKKTMFTRLWIFVIVSYITLAGSTSTTGTNYGSHNATTCEEFERDAYFNPHRIVDSMWKIIYFWSDTTEVKPIIFSLVERKRLKRFQTVVDAIYPDLGVEWHKASFMMEPRPGVQVLFIYSGTPGAFRAFIKTEQRHKVRPQPGPLLKLADVRMKSKGRYMGMMCCEDLTAYVFARIGEVPTSENECVAVATTLGLSGPGGKSYLYIKKMTRTEL